ncbi:MAG: NUDIX hydrolase [Nanoarchaeota archaeon]
MEKSKVRVVGTFIEHDGKFLILRRRPDDGDCWGLPAGGVNKGETDAQAAVREIFEETGYQTKESDIEYLTQIDIEYPKFICEFPAFRLRLAKAIEVKHNPDEHIGYKWVTPEECHAMKDLIKGFHELLVMVGYMKNI